MPNNADVTKPFISCKQQLCFEGDVGHVCMWMRTLILAQAVTYKVVDSIDKYVVQSCPVVNVRPLHDLAYKLKVYFLEFMLASCV